MGSTAWKRSAARIAAPLFAAIFVPAEAEAKVQTLTLGVLPISTYFVNPPFEYAASGKDGGFEVDLMVEIAHRLHSHAVFVNTQWEVILQRMREGRYDCIVGGITITLARQQMLAWSDPNMTTTLSLVVNSDKTPQIHGLAGMKEAIVGVQAATTDYDVARSMQERGTIKDVKVYPFDQIADAIADLAAGRIAAVMKVYPVAAWLALRTPGLPIAAQILGYPQPLGIGFNKDNVGLVNAVTAVLAEVKRDGTYARLAHKCRMP